MSWSHAMLWLLVSLPYVAVVLALPLVEKDRVAYLGSGTLVMANEASNAAAASEQSLVQPFTKYGTVKELYIPSPVEIPFSFESTSAINLANAPLQTTPGPLPSDAATITPTMTSKRPMRTFTTTVTEVKAVSKTPVSNAEAEQGTPTAGYWSLRKDFGRNLSADFGIKTWAWGSSLATALPNLPTMSSAYAVGAQPSAPPSRAPSKNSGRVLQVEYPQGSVNPGSSPQGGVGFYASPIDISRAANVSMGYSIYFPPDFDFVKGGKLPGLYGGHGGCSGGQQSEDCFSTRLMWRKDGMGELYLYAPKDSQTASLCSTPPNSYCDTTYGFSIGRGAWTWKRGQWSDVRQDIWLNTPGKQDGGFNIWINGELVLQHRQVVYRKQSSGKKEQKKIKQDDSDSDGATSADTSSVTSSSASKSATPSSVLGGGLLGGLLGAVVGSELGALRRRRLKPENGRDVGQVLTGSRIGLAKVPGASTQNSTNFPSIPPGQNSGVTRHQLDQVKGMANIWVTPQGTAQQRLGFTAAQFAASQSSRVTFMGMMFDTFFGGSDTSWASPRVQHTYLNSVWLRVNR